MEDEEANMEDVEAKMEDVGANMEDLGANLEEEAHQTQREELFSIKRHSTEMEILGRRRDENEDNKEINRATEVTHRKEYQICRPGGEI